MNRQQQNRGMIRNAIGLVLLLAAPVAAQQADTAVFRVGEIVVQAARPVTTTGGAAAIELLVDSLRLAPAATLEQLLRGTPLVQVRTNSRGEAQFSLRGSGSDARQVAVLVDGMPLSLGWDDRADLSVVPTTAVTTLTLARGLPSLLYGPNVLGGVLELGIARGTTAALNPRGIRVDAGVDHTGAHAASAAITLPTELRRAHLLVRAGGGYRGRDGVALPADVAQPAPADADLRTNTDLVHRDAFMAARLQGAGGAWASLTASGYSAQRGIPAELHITGARFWRYPLARRALGVMAAGTGEKKSVFGGVADAEVSLGIDAGRTDIDQYATRAYDQIVASEEGEDRNVVIRMRADQTLGATSALRAALTYADINHDELLTPGGAASYRQRLWSGAAEVLVDAGRAGPLDGLRLSAGGAYDGADTPESGDKPALEILHAWGARAGLTALTARGRVLLHAGVSRRDRFPALRELYSGALGRFEPNPALRPEHLVAGEAGATLRFGNGELQAVAFRHVLSDAIVRISVPNRKFMRVNRDRQTSTGLELMAGRAWRVVEFGADLTLQDTRLSEGAGQPDVTPEYQPAVLGGLSMTARLPMRLLLQASSRHVGRQSCVNPETNSRETIGASTRFDAEVARAWPLRGGWSSRAEVAAGVDNAGDAVLFDQCGLPQPGRTFRIQLRIR
ncbi:MAG TPA: TonB-dependent receptor [Longimicrobiales bacterium]